MDTGHVFTNEIGEPIHPDHVSNRFEKLCTKAKVPTIRLHDTRHTAASLMLAAGVPVKVVSEMLGHGDVRITLGIYQHVLPSMGADAGAALSALVL
jgi:integrase